MRRRKLSVLNLDGVEGTGKTTQLNIMANHLRTLEIPFTINQLDGSDESIAEAIGKTEQFLKDNPNGLVLNDGTIARAIVIHLSTGTPYQAIEELYKDDLHRLQVIEHQFGMVNVLLIPENLDTMDIRIKRRQELMEQEVVGVVDKVLQNTLKNGFEMFDNSVLSRNLKFQTLQVDDDESIMAVHKNIVSLLEEGFDLER